MRNVVREPQLNITLRDHITALFKEHDVRYEQRFQAQGEALAAALSAAEKAVGAALTAADRAVQKAEMATDKRFESVNEFRQALNDMVRDLLPRKEADQRFGQVSEKLDELLRRQDKSEGTGTGLKAGWGYLMTALVALSLIYNIYVSVKLH